MRRGEASMMRWTTFLESPARGGSTTITSGRPARSSSSGSARRVSPAKKWTLVISLRRAPRDRVGDGLLDELDPPQLAGARGERERDRADPAVEVVDALPALAARRTRRRSRTARSAISVFVWKNASGEIRRSSSPSRSGSSASPHDQLGLAAGGRLGERGRERVHSTPCRLSPSPSASAAASAPASSSPSLVTIRDLQLARCGGPRARRGCAAAPARPRRDRCARRAPARDGPPRPRSHAVRPCSRHQPRAPARGRGCRARRRAGSRRSAARRSRPPGRGSRTRARRRRRCRRSTRACCGSATAPAPGRSPAARSRRAGRSAAAPRRTCSCLISSWRS